MDIPTDTQWPLKINQIIEMKTFNIIWHQLMFHKNITRITLSLLPCQTRGSGGTFDDNVGLDLDTVDGHGDQYSDQQEVHLVVGLGSASKLLHMHEK